MRLIGTLIGAIGDARLERWSSRPELERALFGALARRFDARAAEGFEGRIVYELERPASSGPTSCHTIEIADGRARAHPGAPGEAAVRLRMPLADFLRAAAGTTDPAEPILKNRATVKGDLAVAARLPEMFRAPRPQ
jgi:putative sterol carrier protein